MAGKVELDLTNIPSHVAIIMDGNGRWAKRRFLAKKAGHAAGAQTLRKLAAEAEKLGVKVLTVYAFSTENWKRTPEEVGALMGLLREYIQQYLDDKDKNAMRLSVIGKRTRLPTDLSAKIEDLERMTKDKPGLHLVIALDYGSRDEIIRAAQMLAQDVSEGRILADNIDEAAFAARLDTSGLPDPALLIRTSGELRLSNFLLWQCAYTELVFSDKLWPDFKIDDLKDAILQYQQRERRYGGRL